MSDDSLRRRVGMGPFPDGAVHLSMPTKDELAEAHRNRITALEHALRYASERFSWLGTHHVESAFAKEACRKLADEMWAIQSGSREDSNNEQ